MAPEKNSPNEFADIEQKPAADYSEGSRYLGDDTKGGVMSDEADYSGAVKKTSKEEIALVRKLDWRIMPTLWSMYFLNYVRELPPSGPQTAF